MINILQNIVFSSRCEFCNNPFRIKKQNIICEDCINKINHKNLIYCKHCGKKTTNCIDCQKNPFYSEIKIFSTYTGVLRELIVKYKFGKFHSLSDVFADIIYNDLKNFVNKKNIDYILPVPSSKDVEKERGFNHLSKILEKIFPKKLISNDLIKIKQTNLQVKLTATQRQENLKNSFYLKRPYIYENKNLLIFDDILTTGATLKEANKSVKNANPKNLYAYVIAMA